jgi:Protein of unknown function (DUF1090)
MKNRTLVAFLVCVSVAAPLLAQEVEGTGCAAKRQELNQQIEQAHASRNGQQEAGLKRALEENQEHCIDDSLKARRHKKVAELQEEVTEREADLKKAEAKGNARKIEQRKAKLAEAQKDLADAQSEGNG